MWSRDLEARLTQTRGHDGPAAADLVLPQLGRAFLPVQGSAACKIDACRCGAFRRIPPKGAQLTVRDRREGAPEKRNPREGGHPSRTRRM